MLPQAPHTAAWAPPLPEAGVWAPRPPHLLFHSRTRWRRVCMLSRGPHPRGTTMNNHIRKPLSRVHSNATRGCLNNPEEGWHLPPYKQGLRHSDRLGSFPSSFCFEAPDLSKRSRDDMLAPSYLCNLTGGQSLKLPGPQESLQHDPLMVSRMCHEMVRCEHQLHEYVGKSSCFYTSCHITDPSPPSPTLFPSPLPQITLRDGTAVPDPWTPLPSTPLSLAALLPTSSLCLTPRACPVWSKGNTHRWPAQGLWSPVRSYTSGRRL